MSEMNKGRSMSHCVARLRWLALAAVLAVLAGCGGGAGDGDGPEPGGGWIVISTPTADPSFTDYCNTTYLAGEAFISPDWSHCCSGSAEDTGVTVTWYNASTGAGGAASQHVDICYLFGTPYLCNHTWSAVVPLAVGLNEVRVTATDPGGLTGTDEIAITHPEITYSLSGAVTTSAGSGLGYADSAITLELDDGTTTRRTVTSVDGSYRFSCVRDGSYVMTPSSPIDYLFVPLEHRPTVAGGDMGGLDFTTDAWFLSGQVVDQDGFGVWGTIIEVTAPGTQYTEMTDLSGMYRMALPNGSYNVRAYDPYGLYPVEPGAQIIVIDGADIVASDFLALR